VTATAAIPIEDITEPFTMLSLVRHKVASIHEYLIRANEREGGWALQLEEDGRGRENVLDALYAIGEFLAHLTVVVSRCNPGAALEDLDARLAEDRAVLEEIRRVLAERRAR